MKASSTKRTIALALAAALAGSVSMSMNVAAHAATVDLKMVAADYPGDGKTQQAQ